MHARVPYRTYLVDEEWRFGVLRGILDERNSRRRCVPVPEVRGAGAVRTSAGLHSAIRRAVARFVTPSASGVDVVRELSVPVCNTHTHDSKNEKGGRRETRRGDVDRASETDTVAREVAPRTYACMYGRCNLSS